ncbi:MAG: PAS domain S-box protein [Desulfuromonadales bacterium]
MLIHLTNDTGAIKRSHILAFLVIVLLICVIGYGYFRSVKQLIMAEKTAELTTIANLKSDQIVQWRKERLGDGFSIMRNSLIADRLRDYLRGSLSPVVLEELKVWLESLRTSYDYRSAALYGVDGRVLVAVHDAGTQLDLMSRQLVDQIAHKPEVYFSDFHRDEDSGSIHLNLVVPVGHTVEKKFESLAVLVLDIDPYKFLYPLINKWPTASKSAETILLERNGDDALFLNDARLRPGTALSMRMPLARKEMPGVRAVLGQEAVFEGKDYNNAPVLAATRTIAGSPWALVAKINLAEIYEPLKARAWWVVFICALLVLASGLAIYSWWSNQTVKSFKESDEKLHAIADHTYDWEYWKGVDGSISYCSPSCERISGYTAEQFRQDPDLLIRIIHPDDRDRYRHNHDFDANGLAPADCRIMDFRIHTRSGEERWIAHICQEIFDDQGASLGRRACNHDITIRKMIEESLTASQAELQAIYDSTPVMMCLVNTERRITYANHAFTLFTGMPPEYFEGGHPCGVFGCVNALDDPRGCGYGINCRNCSLMRTIDDSFVTGNAHHNEEHSFTIERHGNRQEFTILVSSVLIDSAGGNRLLLCLQDITEHTHLEELNQSKETLKIYAQDLEKLVAARTRALEDANYELIAINQELEQRRLEAESAHSKLLQLSTAVENSPVTIVITDKRGIIEYVNPRFTEISGYQAEEAIGQNPRILKAANQPKLLYQELWETILAGNTWRGDLRNRKKNGDIHWEHASISPIRDKDGTITHFVAIKDDITEQRKMLEDLLNARDAADSAKERLILATKIGGIGVWEYDLVNNSLVWDKQMFQLYGVRPEEFHVTYDTWRMVMHPDDLQRCDQEVDLALQGTKEFDTEFRVVWPDSSIHHLRAMANVQRGNSVRPLRMIGTNWDITEFKQTEAQLKNFSEQMKQKNEVLEEAMIAVEQAGRAKGEFLANMSHEIRTPLNAIIGFSALVLKTAMTPRQQDFIGKIHTAGELLLNIINDILDFSKIEAGQMAMEQIPFRLNIIVENASSLVLQKAVEKGVMMCIDTLPEAADCLVGDPHRLSQIIVNLLNNAVKFTEHGEVRLETTLLEQEETRILLKFSVHDTGIGISAEHISKLFRPFVQADGSNTRRFGGTGLGLTISKQLAENMGGEIWCESTPGEGSTFSFTAWFGLCRENDMEQCNYICTTITDDKQPSFDFSGSRLLLVEDNEINRQLAMELLKDTGAFLDVAENGEEAVAMVTGGTVMYDLVLMDIQMPVMNGYEATRIIRGDSRFTSLPIIAMTAHAMEDERQKILKAGIDAHITKPIEARTMLQVMRFFLQEHQSSTGLKKKFEETVTDEIEIPEISGLDTEVALSRFDGDRKLYLWVLKAFIVNEANAATNIGEALNTGDISLAARLAHTIKGTAGTMGAVKLEELALALEAAINGGEPAIIINNSLEGLATELSRLVADLKGYLPVAPRDEENQEETAFEAAVVRPILIRLLEYIKGRDGRAERYMEDYGRELAGLPHKELARIQKYLTNFDFTAADKAVTALAARNGIDLTTEESRNHHS